VDISKKKQTVSEFGLVNLPRVDASLTLYNVLHRFQMADAHIAVVTAKDGVKAIGFVTLVRACA
jgi:CBS domain containing-hemolysin-like protein